ncbi:hypothetical protein AFE_1261 [Acidithiobacillus ferrooxidans ATCC 23270]|uniref:Uncharacterized protein n=1 Tax=Acidithiobacillus ferrooxidans (strain ATCC 23270 / DSM 14882 / CIP 104768 / NCIMB 8455) TaxID=243159 RepID=B7J8U3_ACIF2|nr:hypothetical protein AFE_1261 [Acidithiobacillus ferrooxidans ATCC 23270]
MGFFFGRRPEFCLQLLFGIHRGIRRISTGGIPCQISHTPSGLSARMTGLAVFMAALPNRASSETRQPFGAACTTGR